MFLYYLLKRGNAPFFSLGGTSYKSTLMAFGVAGWAVGLLILSKVKCVYLRMMNGWTTIHLCVYYVYIGTRALPPCRVGTVTGRPPFIILIYYNTI